MKKILTELSLLFLVILFTQPAFAFRVGGLQNPENVLIDPGTGVYFISGHSKKAGFIWKVDAAGKLSTFIEGGKKGIALHAPKSMALSGDQLYVADGNTLRRFDKTTGNPLGQIDLLGIGGKTLHGLAMGIEGQLFVSDGLGSAIYKIDTRNAHGVSIVVKSPNLNHPTGMVYDVPRNRLIVLSKNRILSVGLGGKIAPLVDNNFKSLSGVDWDRQGNLLVSDRATGTVYRIRNFNKLEVLRQNIQSPAGIAFDYTHNRILVPSVKGNLVFSVDLK